MHKLQLPVVEQIRAEGRVSVYAYNLPDWPHPSAFLMILASLDLMLSRSWKYVPMPESNPHELAEYAMRWCPKPILMVPTKTVPPREDRMARRGAPPPVAPPRREMAAAEAESWLTLSLSTKEEAMASRWTGGLGV